MHSRLCVYNVYSFTLLSRIEKVLTPIVLEAFAIVYPLLHVIAPFSDRKNIVVLLRKGPPKKNYPSQDHSHMKSILKVVFVSMVSIEVTFQLKVSFSRATDLSVIIICNLPWVDSLKHTTKSYNGRNLPFGVIIL